MQIRKLVPALVFLLMGLWLAAPGHAAESARPSPPDPASSCSAAAASVDGATTALGTATVEGIGIPAPSPRGFICQPNGTFCQQAQLLLPGARQLLSLRRFPLRLQSGSFYVHLRVHPVLRGRLER